MDTLTSEYSNTNNNNEMPHKSGGQRETYVSNRRKLRRMRICLLTLLGATLALMVLQNCQTSEALKLKLKDLKKIKKYAFLLAARRKKFYALPFPVPLPVFVKRQQIYTQVPVVPRYVQQPYYVDAPDPYGSMSEQHYASSESGSSKMQQPPVDLSSYYHEAPEQQLQPQPQPQPQSQSPTPSQSQPPPPQKHKLASVAKSSKYLASLANAISLYPSQAGSGSSSSSSGTSSQRELMGKLLSGQAKILPPSSLLSAILSPAKAKPEASDAYDNGQADNGTTKAEPANKPSASELYTQSLRAPPMDPHLRSMYRLQGAYRSPYGGGGGGGSSRLRGMLSPAALYPAHAGAMSMVHHHPQLAADLQQPAMVGAASLDHHPSLLSAAALDSMGYGEPTALDSQESPASAASPSREYELMALSRHRAAATEQLLEQARLRQQQQVLLRSALVAAAAERDEARLAQTNSLAGLAGGQQQYALPLLPEQLRALGY